MSSVAPADSTVAFIRKKVRRLTATSSESSLPTPQLDEYINNFYNSDFPYAIKLDQMRSVYTFFTEPYRDRYPLDVNYNMGVRAPVYFEGIPGSFYKDRNQFFNIWPKFPTKFQQGGDTLTGEITGIAQPTNPTQITSVAHNLTTGAVITITGVVGMTQLNGNDYVITFIDANTFSLNGVDNTAFGAYISGGTWTATNQTFSFTIPAPFLSQEVVIGGVGTFGEPLTINDDGNGRLWFKVPNPVTTVPPYTDLGTDARPIPGMHNQNNGNPGLNANTDIGAVNYVTGQINFTLPFGYSLGAGELFTIWVKQYVTGRPYTLLFWNNEFTVRPVPKVIHKVEVETYLTPVQFMQASDNPILNQWAQYIAYGSAMEILRDRQDLEGVQNLMEGFQRQEALVLERQAVEEIGQPNFTLFNSSQVNYVNNLWGSGAWS